MTFRILLIAILGAISSIGLADATASSSSLRAGDVIEGQLDLLWGDPRPGSNAPVQHRFTVTDERGQQAVFTLSHELMAAHGGFLNWNARRVRVHLAEFMGEQLWRAQALTLLDGETAAPRGGPTGSQPWVSILCKFSDINSEPRNLAYFQDMYANAPGGLDDYWRKQSYGRIDIVGSTAVDWVDLPNPQGFYIPNPGDGFDADLSAIFNDCTAAADPFVDFSNGDTGGFSGINMMLNDVLDCCAWGGGRFATLDGVTKSWRTTWNPPWAFTQAGVIAHEMGHGFGLPHSNNFDGDSNPYDSPYDVMSAATNNAINDPDYGRQGKHHTSYHKDRLGWFDGSEMIEVSVDDFATITIDAMALPTTGNYRMATIPIPDTNDWYTVEVRKRLGYDGNLPGDAVIISYVDTNRSEPAWSVDTDVPPANYANNEGTMFRVGETFTDPTGQITVSVDSETTDGFVVTINGANALILFRDRFQE
ncbi:MAG: hypothetical protein AAGJ52_00275 [Pseudomonadota bacterium]